jgi:hypothetical protein
VFRVELFPTDDSSPVNKGQQGERSSASSLNRLKGRGERSSASSLNRLKGRGELRAKLGVLFEPTKGQQGERSSAFSLNRIKGRGERSSASSLNRLKGRGERSSASSLNRHCVSIVCVSPVGKVSRWPSVLPGHPRRGAGGGAFGVCRENTLTACS